MDSVNKTLYIPLYGKSFVSHKGIILEDPKAEEIWSSNRFPLKRKAKSKWLAYYMAMRAAVFDRWTEQQMKAHPEAVVVQLGCGLDSRNLRVDCGRSKWYDVDFSDVIQERKRYYEETGQYQMIGADLRNPDWLKHIEKGSAIVLMEGVSMYLEHGELCRLFSWLSDHFENVYLLMDCYTSFAARASKFRNPVQTVGVSKVFGFDEPKSLETAGIAFRCEHDMTPNDLIDCLPGGERCIFRHLYAGAIARKMYRLFEYYGAAR
jgi:O-methyltransferase involved in polyketide biosynthesis